MVDERSCEVGYRVAPFTADIQRSTVINFLRYATLVYMFSVQCKMTTWWLNETENDLTRFRIHGPIVQATDITAVTCSGIDPDL